MADGTKSRQELPPRHCVECGAEYNPTRRDQRFCSRMCSRKRYRDNLQLTCQRDSCEAPVRARGLCARHYRADHYERTGPPEPVDTACAVCGSSIRRHSVKGRRPICSLRCRNILRGFRNPSTELDVVRDDALPGPRLIRLAPPRRPPHPKVRFVSASCAWCGEGFIFDRRITGNVAKHCSARCTKAAGKARHRALKGQFSISPRERLRIYERDGWMCQLCGDPVDKTLHFLADMAASLDHIECQSWALVPDHSAENLRLAHRLCNSLRGDESWLGEVS